MNTWSTNSGKQLSTCHRDIQVTFNCVLQVHDCSVLVGHRIEEDQNAAFDSGNSKLRWPDGKHNSIPSMAVDVKPYVRGVKISGANPNHLKYFYKFAGVVIGVHNMLLEQERVTHRLRWGGDWDSDNDLDDQTFNDLYHFGLVKV